jgi:hypothetical protein
MSTCRKFVRLIPIVLAFFATGAWAQDIYGSHASITEATLLPKFCWGQYFKERFKGPEFEIPRRSCGVGMNHYCPGLVALNRANRSFDSKMKRGYLRGAQWQVRYTVKAMEKYPNCPIRGEVMRTNQLIERELRLLK